MDPSAPAIPPTAPAFGFSLSARAWLVWRRNLDVNLVTWQTNFLPPILEPVLYIFAFGFCLGRYVESIEYAGRTLDYLTFVAPGMIAVAIMFHATFECMYGSFIRMYFQRTFDAIVSTPLQIEDVIVGELLWGATKSLFAATVMLAMVALFGLVESPAGLLVVPLALLGGLVFASMGMIFCALVPSIDVLNLPIFLLVTPMFLFSATFFPLDGMPAWGQAIALLSPLTHVARAARGAMLGSLGWAEAASVIALFGMLAALATAALTLMKRRLVK